MAGKRYAVVAVVVVAAIITPPDPISQILLSAPNHWTLFRLRRMRLAHRARRRKKAEHLDARDVVVLRRRRTRSVSLGASANAL